MAPRDGEPPREKELARIQAEVKRRTRPPLTAAEIGRKAGRALHCFKMGKHFQFDIQAGHFAYQRNPESIEAEARLDGVYIVCASEPAQQLSAEDTLLQEAGTRTKNIRRVNAHNAQEDKGAFPFHFEESTEPTPFQQHVFDLLGLNCA